MSGYFLLPSVFSLLVGAIGAEEPARPQTVELRAGELRLVLGNEADHGAGRTGYIGIWSLTSVHEPTNLFVPRYAGWIQSRGRASVTRVSDVEGVIQHLDEAGRPTIRQTFKLLPPYSFDCTFSRVAAGNSASFAGKSYMNGPEDPGIYFLDPQMRWQRHYDPEHGNAASILPQGMPLPVLERVPHAQYRHGTNSFSDSVSQWRYHPDYALFYGRFKEMVLIHMFPPRCNVIPYMSPSGGGSQPDGRKNPAWDWHGPFALGAAPNTEAHLTVRAVYKRYVSDADILEEYRRWVATIRPE
jgi:hypothetical protein